MMLAAEQEQIVKGFVDWAVSIQRARFERDAMKDAVCSFGVFDCRCFESQCYSTSCNS